MLNLTEHVFPWNKYFDHLKNFMLLITDSVSMQAIYFFLFVLHLPNEGCGQENFWQDLHSSFLEKALFSFLSRSRKSKLFKNETSQFFKVPLKVVGGWPFLLFKKFNQNEKNNVNLYFHPSYWSLEKFYGSRKSLH